MSLANLFLELGSFDPMKKQTRFVHAKEFIGKYAPLQCGNGGSWCRFDGTFGKSYKLITVKRNGTVRYSWDVSQEEEQTILSEIQSCMDLSGESFGKGVDILLFRIYGEQTNEMNRAIRKDIRESICKQACVVCGCTSNVECDHKNDLYNDPRVNNLATQRMDDFQPLCKHCNDQKRQTIKKTKEVGKRYGATNIPSLKALGAPDFTVGNETFDPKDPNAMVGTYWYDPIAFMKSIRQ